MNERRSLPRRSRIDIRERGFLADTSYVTPSQRIEAGTTRDWFMQVAETEIGPLLEEYWFDSPKTAADAIKKLVAGW